METNIEKKHEEVIKNNLRAIANSSKPNDAHILNANDVQNFIRDPLIISIKVERSRQEPLIINNENYILKTNSSENADKVESLDTKTTYHEYNGIKFIASYHKIDWLFIFKSIWEEIVIILSFTTIFILLSIQLIFKRYNNGLNKAALLLEDKLDESKKSKSIILFKYIEQFKIRYKRVQMIMKSIRCYIQNTDNVQ